VIDCTIRDLSDKGAKITCAAVMAMPKEVELAISRTGEHFQARVMWSKGQHHGLMFLRQPQSETSRDASIPAVLEEARQKIAQLAGVAPESVRLKLEVDH
jgi:hypothetical protein